MSFKQLNNGLEIVEEKKGNHKIVSTPARLEEEKKNYATRTECKEFQILLSKLQVFDCVNPHSFPLLQPFITFKSNYFDSDYDFHSGVAELARGSNRRNTGNTVDETNNSEQQSNAGNEDNQSENSLVQIDLDENDLKADYDDEEQEQQPDERSHTIVVQEEDDFEETESPKKKSKKNKNKSKKKSKQDEDEDDQDIANEIEGLPGNPPQTDQIPPPSLHLESSTQSPISSSFQRSHSNLHIRSPSSFNSDLIFPEYQQRAQLVCSFTDDLIPPLQCSFDRVINHQTASDVLFHNEYKRNLLTFSRSQLTLVLRDRSWIGDKDYIGVSSIELAAGCNEQPVWFISPILTHTKYNGFIIGTIQIVSNNSNTQHTPLVLPIDMNDRDKLHNNKSSLNSDTATSTKKGANTTSPKTKAAKKSTNNNINNVDEDYFS